MYEQDETPTLRRGLWMVVWFIAVVAVLWFLVWLVFFRHPSPKPSTLHGSSTGQNQSDDNHTSTGANSKNAPDSSSKATGDATTPGAAAGTPPTRLANTGAGNVLVPFAIASVTGSTLYYIRLRRKLSS